MTTTPNPTAEQIVSEALGPYGLIGRARDLAARNAVERLRANGLLSEGTPSEAQVEAALAAHEAHKGAWVDEFREMVCPECGWCYMTEHERRPGNKPSNEVVYARVDAHRMRAALVAAQGAARPVNGFDTTPERVKTGDDSLHVAPVPSSGVDEDALAEVIAKVQNVPFVGNRQKAISRAVAEWLKGQGRR